MTTVSRIVYRIRAFFKGLWESLDFSPAVAALTPAILKIREIFDTLGRIFSRFFGGEVTSASASFENFGSAVGKAASWILEAFATAVNLAVNAIGIFLNMLEGVGALFRGDFVSAAEAGKAILAGLGESILALADLFGIGDWLRAAWDDAVNFLGSINLFESGARILETLKEGILSAAASVKDSVMGVFQSIRDLLPFSDAREGPFSELTLSGTKLMTTLAEGVLSGASALVNAFTGVFSGISKGIGDWWDGLFAGSPAPDVPKMPELPPAPDVPKMPELSVTPEVPHMPELSVTPEVPHMPDLSFAPVAPEIAPVPLPEEDPAQAKAQGRSATAPVSNTYSYTFHITGNFPNVKDGKDFLQSLNDEVNDYGGGFAPA